MKFITAYALLLAIFTKGSHTVQVNNHSAVINATKISVGGQYHPHSLYTRPWALQYTSWYPKYASIFRNITEISCNESFQEYQVAYHAPADSYSDYILLMTCYQTEACIYEQLTANQQMNF